MTAPMHVENVPPGRKVRAIKTCPWWCDQDDQHTEFGDGAHYSAADQLTTDQLSAWLDTTDDGATVELRLCVSGDVRGGTVMLDAEAAQKLVDDLQAMVDIANGSTPDNHPPVRDEIISHDAWLQERIDAAVLALRTLGNDPVDDGPKLWLAITQVLTVLEGMAPADAIVRRKALTTWSQISRDIEQLRALIGNTTLDEAVEPTNGPFKTLIAAEAQRRTITHADVLQPEMRR